MDLFIAESLVPFTEIFQGTKLLVLRREHGEGHCIERLLKLADPSPEGICLW